MRFRLFKTLILVIAILLFNTTSSSTQPKLIQEIDEHPLSYGLVIDNSGSLRTQIDYIIAVGKLIVNSNKENDETFLVRFVDRKNIQRVTNFTQSKELLIEGLDSLYAEGGQTAIIDAVHASAQYLVENSKSEGANRRRVLILITDGEDRDSHFKIAELLKLLRDNKIEVFAIGFTGRLKKDQGKKTYDKAVGLLNTLAKETGGKAFFPETVAELDRNVNEIVNTIHN